MDNSVLKRFNVRVFGQGKQPILFAHGLGCDQIMWRFLTPSFKDQYQIVLFDFLGAGKSDWLAYQSEKYSSLNGYADDILEICTTLQLKNVIFVGHSVSSMIGALTHIKNPSLFSSLIMIGPSPCYLNHGEYQGGFERKDIENLLSLMTDMKYWANIYVPLIMGNPERPELAQELNNSFCSTDPEITRQFAEVTFLSDNRNDLKKITIPVLILQCAEDVIAPDQVGKYVRENIKGSKIKFLQATGHCPHLSAPAETINAIKEFLGEINV